MTNFVSDVDAFLFQEKGVHIMNLAYMEMPKDRERYNLSKTEGNVNLIAGRFKTPAEADAIIDEFLSMTLP